MKLHDKNNLVLDEPIQQKWRDLKNKLEINCNMQQLQYYTETFIPWLGKKNKTLKKSHSGKIIEAEELKAMMRDNASKYAMSNGIAFILASKSNLQRYIDSLKPEMCELWRTVLLNGYVSHNNAKEILGIKDNLFDEKYSYYYYSNSISWKKDECKWFNTTHLHSSNKREYGYRSYEDYITVNNTIRGIFFPAFFPELQQPDQGLETLPEGQWRVIDFETESISAFNLFVGLFKQGELPMKKKGVTAADIKRVNKKLALTEFFPDDHNEYREYLRAYNYLGILSLNEHLKSTYKAKKQLSYPDTLLDLFKNFDKFNQYLPALLYPHIKGLRMNQTQWGHHSKLCKHMMEWLKYHPNNWISINEIYKRIVELGSDGSTNIYTALVYNPNEEQNTSQISNLYSSKEIDANSYAREFGYTGLQSFAFILASFGMTEIAVGTDDKTSPFDMLEYVRLTPLGQYALGVTKEYEPPVIQQEAYFELDPERLIIRSLQDPNPYEQLLRDTAMPISRGRFQTSALSFLTNCRSRSDVEGKISIFKQFIASELPPLWEQFFQSLLQHCNPLQQDNNSYRHYTLQPDNRDLIHLITTDPVLRQIAIRAEGYRILVMHENLQKFETQLKKHGYLL